MNKGWSPRGLANSLTILRILVIPVFMLSFFYANRYAQASRAAAGWYYGGALVIFGLASLTDFLDGRIARSRGVTEFGKFVDPIADKLLVLMTLAAFKFWGGLIPIWMILVIAGREIAVTVLRSALVARGGKVISASQWGKLKTLSQMTIVVVSLVLLSVNSASGYPIEQVQTDRGPIFWMMWIPMILTIVSGCEFVYNNRLHVRALAARGSSLAL